MRGRREQLGDTQPGRIEQFERRPRLQGAMARQCRGAASSDSTSASDRNFGSGGPGAALPACASGRPRARPPSPGSGRTGAGSSGAALRCVAPGRRRAGWPCRRSAFRRWRRPGGARAHRRKRRNRRGRAYRPAACCGRRRARRPAFRRKPRCGGPGSLADEEAAGSVLDPLFADLGTPHCRTLRDARQDQPLKRSFGITCSTGARCGFGGNAPKIRAPTPTRPRMMTVATINTAHRRIHGFGSLWRSIRLLWQQTRVLASARR